MSAFKQEKPTTSRPDAHPSSNISELDKEWANKLGNLSTALLSTKLSNLRSKSSSLSTALTAKLASSPSGQNLLHIGPSLSSLPPDLQNLSVTLQPLLQDVELYIAKNRNELERIVDTGRNIEIALRRAEDAKDCREILMDLKSLEECIYRDFNLRKKFNVEGSIGKQKMTLDRDKSSRGNRNSAKQLESDILEQRGNYSDEMDTSDHMASLERCAHITLYLVQQLTFSSSQVTSTLNMANNINKSKANTLQLPSMEKPLPQDTEKAQFIMKLAPRIRTMENKTFQALVANLEIVLVKRMERFKNSASVVDRNLGEKGAKSNGNVIFNAMEEEILKGSNVKVNDNCVEREQSKEDKEELLILGHIMRALTLLGRGPEAEATFAKVAIMPVIRSKLSLGKLDEGGSRGECSGLLRLLSEIVYTVKDSWGDVLRYVDGIFDLEELIEESAEGNITLQTGVDLITSGVWVPIVTALKADPAIRMAIFSPGIANILQANYTAFDTFLSNLAYNLLQIPSDDNAHATDSSLMFFDRSLNRKYDKFYFQPLITEQTVSVAQSRIYSHTVTSEFLKKWNLPIYYQLRFGEACSRLNKAIDGVQKSGWFTNVFTGTEKAANNLREKLGFELPFFLELYDTMMWFWGPHILLKPLTHRFLRGATQLLGRAIAFVIDGLDKKLKFGVTVSVEETSSQFTAAQNQTSNGNSRSQASISIIQDTSYFWGERIEDIASVCWELTVLESLISHEYFETIVQAVSPSEAATIPSVKNKSSISEELAPIIVDVLEEASQELGPIIVRAWNHIIVDALTTQCSKPLSAVKGVAATYRMTNRPPPTQASPFVSTILRPLNEFDDKFSSRIPPQVGTAWKEKIVATVAGKYSSAVSELIETVQRTEVALKNRKARRAAVGQMSDGEKVKLQLSLDQKEFVRNIEISGIDSSSLEGVKHLFSLTEPE